jgi:exodeoxyribonuclease V beta subunit
MSEPRRYPRPALLDRVRPGTTAIEASAGTGKTWTLERLVVDLLLTRGLTLDQILVVTYTEKAASEMLERIRALLQLLATGGFKEAKPGESAWRLGPEELRLLEAALGSFDRAGISTIHAFCQRILAETAFLSGRPFETELAPGAELFQAEFQSILRERWAADPHKRDLLAFGMGLFGSEDALLEFLMEADKASRIGEFELEAGGPCALDLDRVSAIPWRSAQEVQAALQGSGIKEQSAKPMAPKLAAFLRSCAHAKEAGGLWPVLAHFKSSTRLSDPQLRCITDRQAEPGPVGDLARTYLEAMGLQSAWCRTLVEAFLPDLQAGVAARKEREALVDFDDLIGLVRAALVDPDGGPALAGRLRQRYRAVLVDEFQDANTDQWDIFRTAFQSADTYLVLIGDPKQAIYGFRGGDVPTYLDARDSVDGADRRIPLDRNFRSTSRMIDGYNLLFTEPASDDPLKDRFFSGEIQYTDPVKAGAGDLDWQDPSGTSLPPIHLLEFPLDMENRAADRLGAWITQAVAKEIADLLERGTTFLDPENDDPEERRQALKPQDVFILVRSTRDGLEAAEALRSRGVPVAFYKQEGLGESVEARQVLDLLRAVQEPSNASACGLAWLTPFFGLELGDLGATGDLPEDHPIRARLLEWHGWARLRRYPELYRGLLDQSGLTRRLLAKPDPASERTLGILLQLLEHILEQGAARNLDFERMVMEMESFIERGVLPPGENPDTHRMETDRGAVQVLTMHKAKGLEAKVVALIGKHSDINGREKQQKFRVRRRHEIRLERRSRITWFGSKAVPDAIEAAHANEMKEEEERLLYVALTRAKARLILPFFKVRPGADFDAKGSFSKDGNPKGQYGILNRRLQAFERKGRLPSDLFTLSPAPAGEELQGMVRPPADPAPLVLHLHHPRPGPPRPGRSREPHPPEARRR